WLVPDMRVLIFFALAASAVVALSQDPQDKVAHQEEVSAASYNLPSRRLAGASAAGCFGLCRTSSIDRQDSGRRDSGRQNSGGRGSYREDETVINPLTPQQKARKKQRNAQSIENAQAALAQQNRGRGSPKGRRYI
ncbi:unnamed protein product, partial [Aphanomyces euteiches]